MDLRYVVKENDCYTNVKEVLKAYEFMRTKGFETELVIIDEEITSDSYGMIVKKGNKELLDSINKVIGKLKSEGKIDEFVLNHTEE